MANCDTQPEIDEVTEVWFVEDTRLLGNSFLLVKEDVLNVFAGVGDASDAAASEDHQVGCECACLVGEDVLNSTELLMNKGVEHTEFLKSAVRLFFTRSTS
jgi:hypothetical protein